LIVPKHIKRAFEYISENYSNANVCEKVPLYAGISIRTLQAGFRKHYGKTITQSLQDIRLDELKKRIDQNSAGVPVSELMLDVGLSHFSRAAAAYKQRFGVSPSQVKKQFLIIPCEQ
ncbi:MAG: helix-turn-helix domain-containing protein, partial [Rhodospirillaceae bacterium]|nr:helix-turn-helix domain-containing protein [Rhodospirillaceae bacterium]